MKHIRKSSFLPVLITIVLLMALGIVSSAAAAPLACGPFSDIPTGAWYCTNVLRLLNLNITTGTSATTYSPTNYVTRYQMAAFIDRVTTANTDDNLDYIFSLDNKNNGSNQSGDAIEARSYAGNGLYAYTYGGNYAEEAIVGLTNSTASTDAAVWGTGGAAYGVHGASVSGNGVDGFGNKGVYGWSYTNYGEGVHGYGSGSNTEGVLGTTESGDGVYGISGSGYGVRGQTGATWGLLTTENLYVGGSCTGCSTAYIGLNTGDYTLEYGDVVSVNGVSLPLKGGQNPLMNVDLAGTTEAEATGVVLSRAVIEPIDKRVPSEDVEAVNINELVNANGESTLPDQVLQRRNYDQRETIEIASMTEGSVAPGDYLFIVVQGLAQVKVDAAGGAINAGDALVAGDGKFVKAQPVEVMVGDTVVLQQPRTIGQALESLPEGQGLIWVLIDIR
jgi:hypothetical protein